MRSVDEFRGEIASFADDETEVIVQSDGRLLFVRNGQDVECRIFESSEGTELVELDGATLPYRKFLSHTLGRLDVLAQRLLAKRPRPQFFIDGGARLDTVAGTPQQSTAMELLDRACTDVPSFSSRVLFVTADAGHGKTVLLREYQFRQARRFLDGQSSFLFWHVDLQGRQLLRLSEALMGDLGDLRLAGLWMSSIVTLLRVKALVIGIDGFDELAAEQGTTDALGALALLLNEMNSRGVIVAASRRTFFDTDDYLKRTKLLQQGVASQCEFDQLRLLDWNRDDTVGYLSAVEAEGRTFIEPQAAYDDLLAELGGRPDHPMLSRPFLVTHIAKALLRYELTPREFIGPMQDPMEGVASVVKAFISREVEQKWKDHTTGEPYLSTEQHTKLLAVVAEEMWTAQRARLSVETIELLASTLMDDWGTPADRRRQTIDMIKMHVLLTIPENGPGDTRSFDHPEFRDYFLAQSLVEYLGPMNEGASLALTRLLSVAQLPDSVARFAAGMYGEDTAAIENLLGVLSRLVADEWRPTFLQTNVGTIVPYLLGKSDGHRRLVFDAKVVYPSLVFEDLKITNVELSKGALLHASLRGVNWSGVTLRDCDLVETIFDRRATYHGVMLIGCRLGGIAVVDGDEQVEHEYAPARMIASLKKLGISVSEAPSDATAPDTLAEFLAVRPATT